MSSLPTLIAPGVRTERPEAPSAPLGSLNKIVFSSSSASGAWTLPYHAAKAADIVLSDRDILETRTNIKKVYVKGRAFGSPLARGLYQRASTAEVDPRAKPGDPAAVDGRDCDLSNKYTELLEKVKKK
jgi:hypothetical protein